MRLRRSPSGSAADLPTQRGGPVASAGPPFWLERRGRDLNPRRTFQHVRDFQSRSLDHSDTSPLGGAAYRRASGGAPSILLRGGTADYLAPSPRSEYPAFRISGDSERAIRPDDSP